MLACLLNMGGLCEWYRRRWLDEAVQEVSMKERFACHYEGKVYMDACVPVCVCVV